jgi:hypothetical protein
MPRKFWFGGQLGIKWRDEEDEAGEEPLNVEGAWADRGVLAASSVFG